MKLKKLLSITLAAMMIASVTACGGAATGEPADSTQTAVTEAAVDSTDKAVDSKAAAKEKIKPEDVFVCSNGCH